MHTPEPFSAHSFYRLRLGRQILCTCAPLPYVVIHAARYRFGFLIGKWRSWERPPKAIEDKHFDLGLGGGVLRPILHRPEQVS